MRVLTYLGFTLLSILIQFSVVDFIQSLMQHNEQVKDKNISSQKRQLADVFRDFNKPHALYYQTPLKKRATKIYDNTTLLDLLTSEETTTAVLEVLYDESTSITDYESSITTEVAYTTTEIDNVTDLSFFENNKTSAIPSMKPKKKYNRECKCDFLYGACDINCCCDADCSESEIKMFKDCTKNTTVGILPTDVCYSHLVYFGQEGPISTVLNDWFCIVKVNLPKKVADTKKIHSLKTNNYFAWKSSQILKIPCEFTNKIYELGDPIWLIKNGSIYYIDSPFPKINNYCNGRKAIRFLKDQKTSCHVRIRDIEMIQIIKSSEEASVISATPLSMNSTVLNCSSLHCINWTLVICENRVCTNYNKSTHEPVCTETSCSNIALKVEYIFNYHESKITNATIKFHVQSVKVDLHFISQEIEVKFVLTNTSIDQVLTLSGNPGYVYNLPVITSQAEGNFTETFYNQSSQSAYLTLPGSREGSCVAYNTTDNLVRFGTNKRIKCRYFHKLLRFQNGTEQCKSMQNNINTFFDLKKKVISPLGDPHTLNDHEWIPVEQNITNPFLHGLLDNKSAKLHCYNIITRFSFVFSFVNNGGNRILGVKFDTTARNASFVLDDIYVLLTIDVNFVDESKPSIIEYYSSSPDLNYHLPRDFFLPYPSNESPLITMNVFALIYCCIAVLVNK